MSNVKMQICGKGTYQGATGATGCLDSRWDISRFIGATGCVKCAAGKYSNATGATEESVCEPCPKGHYCQDGQSIPCPADTYYPITGATGSSACLTCQSSTRSDPGAEQYYCPVGTYKGLYHVCIMHSRL